MLKQRTTSGMLTANKAYVARGQERKTIFTVIGSSEVMALCLTTFSRSNCNEKGTILFSEDVHINRMRYNYRVTISRRLSAWVRSFSHDCMRARSLAFSVRWILTTAMT